ncbi:MAG: Uma2 family endonuclease [Thermoanaerobaculia bacterium]|nr:Uma2 family endonuclease [Thermoanaerobaculia bacterium]
MSLLHSFHGSTSLLRSLLGPGADGSASRYDLPSQRDPHPCVDDHIVEPETRAELLHGRKLWASPARPAHARQHSRLAHLLEAHIAEGYLSAVDMLTRTGPKSDFAPDASVYPAVPNPATGRREIEELAFEICSQQALKIPTEKARELIRRGVRRVFCLIVPASEHGTTSRESSRRSTEPRMLEWSRETDGWSPCRSKRS